MSGGSLELARYATIGVLLAAAVTLVLHGRATVAYVGADDITHARCRLFGSPTSPACVDLYAPATVGWPVAAFTGVMLAVIIVVCLALTFEVTH